jgi:AbrB family looped-hinge helix DNA binding protein
MAKIVVSSGFRIVIPRDVRESLGLKVGQVLQVVGKNGVITLVPDQTPSLLKGSLKGMSTTSLREKGDRF